MVKHYKECEMTWIRFEDKDRVICPECCDHKQIHAQAYTDCVNTYIIDVGEYKGQTSQCCCYSKEHMI